MPPKRSITLTEAELRLMRVLWQRGEASVAEVAAAIAAATSPGTPLAYNSVLTTIRVLEQKGYLTHRQEGRAFLYSPCIAAEEASRSEIRHVLRRFFGDSRESLLLSLLGDDDVTPAELARLREAIAAAKNPVRGHSERRRASAAVEEPAMRSTHPTRLNHPAANPEEEPCL